MAQLWGGRFTKQTDDAVKAFNDSLGFDRRLYRQDICGSMVHARMLGKQGIISARDCEEVDQGLKGILEDIEAGRLEFSTEYEDIHSFVEANLIDRIGDAGKRLHTGRSRNDQVGPDPRTDPAPAQRHSGSDGRAQRDLYARVYTPAEGTAHDAGPLPGRLL